MTKCYKKKRKRGFTDRLYFANLIFAWGFVVVCLIITIFSGKLGITDMAVITVGVPAIFTELGIHTGFIIWKAKSENQRKFGQAIDFIE